MEEKEKNERNKERKRPLTQCLKVLGLVLLSTEESGCCLLEKALCRAGDVEVRRAVAGAGGEVLRHKALQVGSDGGGGRGEWREG